MAGMGASVAVLSAAVLATACATAPHRYTFSPSELEAALRTRLPAGEVVVPYAISPAHAALIAEQVGGVRSTREKVEIIISTLFDPRFFGLTYRAGHPGTAEEAFARRGGDCLALASAFIGLARAVGLEANYVDVSVRVHETQYLGEGTAVNLGHVTAMVRMGDDRYALDFEDMGRVVWYRVMDDQEAVAHLLNNRGYALLDEAEAEGRAPDWAAAGRLFRLALAVTPDFARGWNNLGLAEAHLGHPDQAIAAYHKAIALDEALAAARANLAVALLARDDLAAAEGQLEAAARSDPGSAHVQYLLAVVRLRSGDRAGARRAAERATGLRANWKAAEDLLASLRDQGHG